MKRNALLTAVTTIGATCLLPVAVPAQAEDCGGFYAFPHTPAEANPYYGFPFNVELVQDNGIHVYLQTTDNDVQQAMYLVPDAPLVGETAFTGGDPNPAGDPVRGAAEGGLHGRTIEFKVRWQNEFTNVYTGQVNDDGSASGTTINNTATTFLGATISGKNAWHSAFADFRCAPSHPLGRRPVEEKPPPPVGDNPVLQQEIDPALQQQILGSLPQVTSDTPQVSSPPTAMVISDVDVYNAKNEPDGAGQIVGVLPVGTRVNLVGDCAPSSWCEVSGDSLPVPGQHGWIWGHLTRMLG